MVSDRCRFSQAKLRTMGLQSLITREDNLKCADLNTVASDGQNIKSLASCYLTEVLLKEGLAAILEKLLKLEYRKADQEGRETETSSLNRSVNIAEKLYEKKKRQYELNISSERQ